LPEDKREKNAGNPFYAGMNMALEAMLGKGE